VSHFLLTDSFTQRDAVKWVKNFFGVKEINAARQRLERLLQEEDRAVGSQTLKAVEDNKASTDGVQRTLSTFDVLFGDKELVFASD